MRVTGVALLGLLLVGGVAGERLAARKAGDDCAALVGFRDARLRLEVTAAEQVPAAAPGTVRAQPYLPPLSVGLPAYCKVSGRIDT
ncbi:MAG: tannase/feruloyl esterase family alpha/beta hydrolase, partial [Pseudoxanthomonas sp.]|nr:tannase/feruloyl esterase family alpha/beta hydrolase [Pseudoxanthomonas sp.]